MSEQMQKELLARIDLLAAKFATTGSHLWEVMVKQQIINGWVGVFWAALFLIATVVAVRWCLRKLSKGDYYGDSFDLYFGTILIGVVGLYGFAISSGSVARLFNPEYYALMDLLGR